MGDNQGTIDRSFSSAYVEAKGGTAVSTHQPWRSAAGGIAGYLNGTIIASYFTGHAYGETRVHSYVGGIVGRMDGGSVKASYSQGRAHARVRAQNSTLYNGGIVGQMGGGTVEAVWAAGELSGTDDDSQGSTRRLGGVIGNDSGGTMTNAYYDSTVITNTSGGRGTATTTAALQTPTGYTGIYSGWNLNLDGVTGGDDPWDFGTSSQYPVIKYKSYSTALQRGVVTLTASPAVIYESVGGPTQTTITATLNAARTTDTTVELPANANAYTMTPTNRRIVIPHGALTGTLTLTAVNNTTDAADLEVDLTSGGGCESAGKHDDGEGRPLDDRGFGGPDADDNGRRRTGAGDGL